MKHEEELLHAWRSRTGPGDTEQFSQEARQRIASLIVDEAGSTVDQYIEAGKHADLDELSTQLAELGIDEGFSASVFCAELRNCQLSLFAILTSEAVAAGLLQTANEQQGALQSLAALLAKLDGLITLSVEKFMEIGNTPSGTTTSSGNNGKQGKTLQHEIRTPLQGALLTTELMLEDAGQGDPVSAEDILAVRKSIETAVGILNDFASRSSPE